MGVHDGHRERLRERFSSFGLDNFNDLNALELLLFYAIPRRDTNEIAHALLDQFGSLDAVFDASPQESTTESETINDKRLLREQKTPKKFCRLETIV